MEKDIEKLEKKIEDLEQLLTTTTKSLERANDSLKANLNKFGGLGAALKEEINKIEPVKTNMRLDLAGIMSQVGLLTAKLKRCEAKLEA